jgi:hypothetical protein
VRQYRYRTPALTGPWRDSRAAAVNDAVRAKQAEIEEEGPSNVRWIVPGRIEERGTEEKAARLKN